MPQLTKTRRKKTRMATPARSIRKPAKQPKIVYANARAKTAWEVRKEVSKITSSIPPENQNLKATTISFDPEHVSRGTYAILFSGTVIGTDRAGVYLVPERTLSILKQLEIPYHAA
jgi:hypothetical protein